MPPGKVTEFLETFGDKLYMLYGSTEVSWASVAKPEELRDEPGTAGRAPVGTELRILDENDDELPAGETGRIFVGNDMLFTGYTGGRGETDVVDGMIGTGDLGHVDEKGLLFISGRADDMIVSGGENIHAGEVESLLGDMKGVREAAVVGVDDDEYGQRLAAYLVLENGASVDADAVRDHVKKHLARFASPRDVEFLDELPRNNTGKVLKKETWGCALVSAVPCRGTGTHAHPAVLAARAVADDLAAGAAAADHPAPGVRPEVLRDLAARGLVSVQVPEARGGFGGDARVAAAVEEVLAGADRRDLVRPHPAPHPPAPDRRARGRRDARPGRRPVRRCPRPRARPRRDRRRPPAAPGPARGARPPRRRGRVGVLRALGLVHRVGPGRPRAHRGGPRGRRARRDRLRARPGHRPTGAARDRPRSPSPSWAAPARWRSSSTT